MHNVKCIENNIIMSNGFNISTKVVHDGRGLYS